MRYIYLPGFPNHPICDMDNLLDAYEHIGEEVRTHALTFVGAINGFLHRLHLEPQTHLQDNGKTVYYPVLTPLKGGEVVDVATSKDMLILANQPG